MPDDLTPSDAQLTPEQRRQVDDRFAADRALDAAEDARVAAQPTTDDPPADTPK